MKKMITLIVLVSIAWSATACNTMEGVGKDTKNAGQSIENAADRNK